jgi:16S rRNA (cytidine1402-2'-O)-methyltransferase
MRKGTLFVVATPIGNLEDITFRAVDILSKVAFILAEDTRESKKLLDRYDISTQLISYRDQNHEKILKKIVEKLDMGLDLALISDSGTPLISDPGFKLVKYLRENMYEVLAIPGASALISALSISGLPTDRFVFLGFLPKSDTRKEKILKEYMNLHNTLVIYESPKRLFRFLQLIFEIFGNVDIFLAKDISKSRERNIHGKVNEVLNILHEEKFSESPHGEFVCLINPVKN